MVNEQTATPVALYAATNWYTATSVPNGEAFVSPQWGQGDIFPVPSCDPDAAPADEHGHKGAESGYRIWTTFGTKEHAHPGGVTYQ
jgi:hypothetical protein